MMTGLNNITGKEFPAWEQSVPNVGTGRSQRGNGVYSAVDAREMQGRSTLVGAWLRCVVMLLLMVVGVGEVWGQETPDFSGIYFIANGKQLENSDLYYNNNNPSVNFYLCPAQYYYNPDGSGTNLVSTNDTGKPFLTTYKTNQGENSIWIIEKVKNKSTYYIKHIVVNEEDEDKYLIKNSSLKSSGLANVDDTRLRVHLEKKAKSDLNADAEFEITQYGSGDDIYYGIKISTITSGWLNPSRGNKQSYVPEGTQNIGGIIGYYAAKAPNETGGEGSKWYFEDARLSAPTITVDNSNQTFTINYTNLPTGCSIHYTTGDGTQAAPTATTGTEYSSAVTVPVGANSYTNVKAAIVGHGVVLSAIADVEIKCTTPTIDIDYNNGIYTATLAPATIGSTIYYRIGTTGDFTQYENPLTNVQAGQTIYTYATKNGCLNSETNSLEVRETCATPNISVTYNNDGTASVAMSSTTTGATIRYTTTGTDPDENTTVTYSEPLTITSGMTIKAIATKEACNNSQIATETITQVATPVITNENNTITITCETGGAIIYYQVGSGEPIAYGEPIPYSAALGLSDNVSGRTIKAYAMKTDMVKSATATKSASETKLKLPTPTISVPNANNNGNVQFSIDPNISDEVTYYYTLDGTTTPTSSTPTSCTGFFTLTAPAIIKVIATSDYYETSEVATSQVNSNPLYIIPTNTQFLIQSKESAFYYLIPNLEISNTDYKNLTTLNVPCSTMVWDFEPATADGQYYYIHNSQNGYMYYTATSNTNKIVYFKATKDTNDNGYKFKITPHASGGYNIIPNGQNLPIYKPSIAANSDADRLSPVKLAGKAADASNATSRWEFIPYTSHTSLPQWTTAPFTASDNENTHFYQIYSVSQPTKPLILNNDGLIKSETVPASDYDLRKSVWVIKKVGSSDDGLLDYYTFENTYNGELLYYNGKGRGVTSNSNLPVLQIGMPEANGADATWSHFVVVQTVSGYNIIPRVIVDNTKAISRVGNSDYPDGKAFNCINRAGGNDSPGTWYDNDNGSRWTFTLYNDPVQCRTPEITYSYQDEKVVISTTHENATIFYTNTANGDDPTDPNITTLQSSNVFPIEIALADVNGPIKAFVRKSGYEDSEIETYTISFDPPVISYDAVNDKIIITPSPGATVYYTTGETSADDPTRTDEQLYNYGISGFDLGDNINVIKAKAVKGAAESEIVTLTIPVHAHTATKDRPYLIQSVQCVDFYMLPGDKSNNITYINTSSLGRPSMEWYFIGAGHEDGVTYYYIQNTETEEYVCYTSNSIRLHTSSTFDAAADKSIYKFSISYANTATNPGYYIHPITNATAGNGLSKKNGNNTADNVEIASATTENNTFARWNFVPSSDITSLAPQLKSWGSDSRKYYQIKNGSNNLLPRTATSSYATASTATENNLWYFDEIESDKWVTYYYIVNATTGEYLYFNGGNADANSNAFEATEELGTGGDRYQFAFAKTITSDQYYILPKSLINRGKNSYRLVYWDGIFPLSTAANRAASEGKWTLTESAVNSVCPPRITLDADGKVNLASRTRRATISYTIDDGNETTFSTNPIKTMAEGGEKVVINTTTAVGEGERMVTTTKEVTVVYKPDIVFDPEQTIVYNGGTRVPVLSSVIFGDTDYKDYCMVLSDAINAGDATALITQKENYPFHAGSYHVIYGTEAFTIDQSPLTITADATTMEYGEQVPTEFTFSTSGLAYTDIVNVHLNCPEANNLSLGKYEIVFSESVQDVTITRQGSDVTTNYRDIALETSYLTVTPKRIGDGVVSAENISIDGTGANPVVKHHESTLTVDVDYTVDGGEEANDRKEVIMTISGIDNYTGAAQVARIQPTFVTNQGETTTEYIAAFNGSVDWVPTATEWGVDNVSKNIWMITSVIPSVNIVTAVPITYLPKDMPVILTSGANESNGIYVVPKSSETESISDVDRNRNLLKMTPAGGLEVENGEVYVFYDKVEGNNEIGTGEFVLALAGTIPAGRFYIDNPNYTPTGVQGAPARLRIIFGESTVSGITELQNDESTESQNGAWYSIDGRRLNGKPSAKGLYIVDGKKVMVK